jgi:Na+/H+ antiporter NhaD/arsenite permease-like protein
MNLVAIAIFLVTYVLISVRRVGLVGIDRPSAALLGAVACVAFGVLTPEAALASIDLGTLVLLFGVMGIGAFLVLDGFFEAVEVRLADLAGSPTRLLAAIVWGAGLLSAFITNDAVCLLGAPLVVRLIQRHRLPPAPFLLALATGANTGSVATLVGNPQNMLCGQLGGLVYLDYALVAVPMAVAGLALNHLVLRVAYHKALSLPSTPAVPGEARFSRRHAITLGVVAITAAAYTLGAPLAWSAAGGVVVLLLVHRHDATEVWRHVDWSLLLFFAGLFVVAEGLRSSGATNWFFAQFPLGAVAAGPLGGLKLAGVFVLGSNAVSNVPFILVVEDQMAGLDSPTAAWTLLAMASTFAGNLTLLGSAANVIVATAGRAVGGLGFWEHLKVGLPIALLTTAMAAGWMALVWG